MPSNGESTCYFIQLQVDAYIDGDLNETQQGVFMSHVHECADCASEYRYAQTVQDAVMELPEIECADLVLEPVHRLTTSENAAKEGARSDSLISQITELLHSIPQLFRYGVPVSLVAVVAISISFNEMSPLEEPGQMVASEPVEQYSQEDISQALQELNVAMD